MAEKFGRQKEIIIGSRGSKLALTQASDILSILEQQFPEYNFKIKIIKTTGDKIQDIPLPKIGDKGLFIKELEEELLAGKIDLAVHSIKDLPVEQPPGLVIGAVPKREDARDAVIYKGVGIGKGVGRVGTSSLRRKAQLLASWPEVEVVDLRGNLDTRIRKLQEGIFEAIVVAAAGIKRLGIKAKGVRIRALPFKIMLPAPGQGALAIECRREDTRILGLLRGLKHQPTEIAVRAERALLAGLGGGCIVPIGAYAEIVGQRLKLSGVVAEINGRKVVRAQISGAKAQPEQLGLKLAQKLIKMGAKKILNASR